MSIDKKDATKIGKLTVPFVLAIVFALLLEDMWDSMMWEHQIATVLVLVLMLLLVYRKKVWNILE